jgi:ABC-type bacteriocin/lantibiotic exporter with double-glycine peptidase domain
MPSRPPFIRQERYDTCALACLRMLLAHHGTEVSEAELVRLATMEEGGLDIEELARLAGSLGLRAEIRELAFKNLAELVAEQRYPIVYLNRLPMDAEFSIHAVVPIRISAHFVTFLDPRRGVRRVASWKFEACRRYLSNFGVVCDAAD